jgi:hypothetical protein
MKTYIEGGITNGNDLVVAYCRASPNFPTPLVNVVAKIADVGDRAHEYDDSVTVFTLGMAWQIIKSFFHRAKTA